MVWLQETVTGTLAIEATTGRGSLERHPQVARAQAIGQVPFRGWVGIPNTGWTRRESAGFDVTVGTCLMTGRGWFQHAVHSCR